MSFKSPRIFCLLTTALVLMGTIAAMHAAPALRLSDGITTITVTDNGPYDNSVRFGEVSYVGSVGSVWNVYAAGLTTAPPSGTATKPYMDTCTSLYSYAPGTLTIELTDTDYGPVNQGLAARIGGHLPSGDPAADYQYLTWADAGNVPFGKSQLLSKLGPLTKASFSGAVSSTLAMGAPFSLTQKLIITHTRAGLSSADAELDFEPLPHIFAITSLPNYQHNPADGRQILKDARFEASNFKFTFSTADPGSICILFWSTDNRQWSPLSRFNVSAPGTEITANAYSSKGFFKACYLPQAADSFDYPIGTGNVLEQITPERNEDDLFPEHPRQSPQRPTDTQVRGAGWYNFQDVGNYYREWSQEQNSWLWEGLHPGEDWNINSETEIGQPVKAVANGLIIDIRPLSASIARLGYRVLIRHWLASGESVDSLYLHVAPDKIAGNANTAGAFGSESDFTYQEGTIISKGDTVAVIGAVTAVPTHLHFEMRDTETDPDDSWPSSTGDSYYGPQIGQDGNSNPDISLEDVQAAFDWMREDGIIDPSDFIDDHR